MKTEEFVATRNAAIAHWKSRNEHTLNWRIRFDLRQREIPYIQECRIYGWNNEFVAVDIAVMIQVDGKESNGLPLFRPFLAVELKNSSSRDELMRGVGQSLTYLHCGFEKSLLVSPATPPTAVEYAILGAGIEFCEPHQAVDVIEQIYRDAGGQNEPDKWSYINPIPNETRNQAATNR